MGGIRNFQIENAIRNIENDDLKNNFVGVFPSNYMNKIEEESEIKKKQKRIKKKEKIKFLII